MLFYWCTSQLQPLIIKYKSVELQYLIFEKLSKAENEKKS